MQCSLNSCQYCSKLNDCDRQFEMMKNGTDGNKEYLSEITAYKTKDGQLFTDKKKAEIHHLEQELTRLFGGMEKHKIIEMLSSDKTIIQELWDIIGGEL